MFFSKRYKYYYIQFLVILFISFYWTDLNALSKTEKRKMDPLLQRIYRIYKEDQNNLENNKLVPVIFIDQEPYVSVSFKFDYSERELLDLKYNIESTSGDISSAIVDLNILEEMLKDEKIIRLEAGLFDQLLLEVSTSDSTINGSEGTVYIGNNADAVQTGSPSYDGMGIIVAVIDPGGINFSHKDFQKANGDTRILYIWDQTTGSGGSNHPSGFSYGTEYDSSDINNGTCYQTAGSHGNSCIGIIAGNGAASPTGKDYTAMAPGADIIFIKGSSNASGNYMQDGVQYVMSKSSLLGKPAVVSISLGNQYGPHDGTSLRVQAIDNLCGTGKMVVFACGNSGSSRIHAETTLSQDGFHTFEVDVANFDIGLDFWFSGDDTLSIYLDSPNLPETGPISFDSTYIDTTGDGIREIYNCTDSPSNSDHHIVVYVSPTSADSFATGSWKIKFRGDFISYRSGHIDGWSYTYNGNYFTSGSGGNTSKSLNGLASGQNTIAAAGFRGGGTSGYATGAIYSGSGRGPTRDGRQKPDIAGNQGVYVPHYSNDTTYVATGSGTSYSAPHVAGAIALMLQKQSNATPSDIKTSLYNSAFTDEYTDNAGTEPNYQVGYGKLNTSSSVEQVLPVVLSTFYALVVDGSPNIFWSTQSETNNSGWNIYRGEYQDALMNDEILHLNLGSGLIPGAGTTTLPTEYNFEDENEVVSNTEYWYWLESVENSGVTQNYGPISLFISEGEDEPDLPGIPEHYGLFQNYPNPFNPDTIINFSLKEANHVMIKVFNVKGELVRTLVDDFLKPAYYSLVWDVKDERGNPVASGIYFYTMKAGKYTSTKKMILMK